MCISGFSAVQSYYTNKGAQTIARNGGAQYSFDANNHITGSSVSYDAAGNVINDGFHSYTYDAENRLIAVDGGRTASYVYDAQGRRVHETLFGNPSDYIFGDQGRVITLLGGAVWARSELYAGGMHVATYADGTTYFDHSDWLGTVRARSYPNGSVAVNCTSLAFGDALNCTGPYASPIHFTGLDHDGEDNLEHTLFRQYSSTEGRWTTPDPAGLAAVDPGNPQSWNRYAYVMDNPLALIDPSGLDWQYYLSNGCIYAYYVRGHDTNNPKEGYIVNAGPTQLLYCFGTGNCPPGLNCAMDSHGSSNSQGTSTVAANNGQTPQQKRDQCFMENISKYSIAGILDATFGSKISENFGGQVALGNDITGLASALTDVDPSGSLAAVIGQTAEHGIENGIGTPLRIGGNTAPAFQTLVPRIGRPAQALLRAKGLSKGLKFAADVLDFKLVLDAGLTVAWEFSCHW